MKVEELVAKVKILSMEEIDGLVDNGIEIENIPQFIFWDNEQMKENLFRNEKLKRLILKEVNSYAIDLFEVINKNPKWEMSPNLQTICKNYLKSFFKDGIELELASEKGRALLRFVLDARGKKQFIKEAALDNKIWGKYINALRNLSKKDMNELSTQQAQEYLLTFGQAMKRIIPGYSIPEAEAILKLVQRDDIEIAEISNLDQFVSNYEKCRLQGNVAHIDEVFSVILDKDILQRKNGIEKQGEYSPINEMIQAIKDGAFGKNNSLSKEEFAFAFKMMQNPELLDGEINQQLINILANQDIQLSIGTREIASILRNQEVYAELIKKVPHLEDNILKQIDANIYAILTDISNNQRRITPEEMDKCSMYYKHYYEMSLSRHSDRVEMTKLVCLTLDLSAPHMVYNIDGVENQKGTTEFFEREADAVFAKYDEQIDKMVERLQSDETMTIEEFKQYDEIFYEFSFRLVQDETDNIKIMKAIEQRSKQFQVRSKALENHIDIYIDKCLEGKGDFKQQGFLETIMQYYETQLQGSALQVNENSAVSHLIRAAQKGKLPKELSYSVLEKLEEANKKRPMSIQIDNTLDIDEYMKKVAETRMHFGRMPRECCDFIIKKAILSKDDIAKYGGMLERAFEDFSEYELEESNIYDYYCGVLDQQFFMKKTWMGQHSADKKMMKLSRQMLQSQGVLKAIDTVLHEETHAEQGVQLEGLVLNRDAYRMLKEQILLEENANFYNDNYTFMYEEIDARKGGYIKRFKTLRRMGFSDSEIMELQAGNIQKKIADYCKECEYGKIKSLGDKTKGVNMLFLEQLQAKPDLIDRHPALHIEFERSGDKIQRRSFANILATYEEMLGQAKSQKEIERISSLCSEILLNGGFVPEEKLQEELEQLIAFKTDNPIINAYKNKILKTKFPKEMVMMSTMRTMYENHSEQERVEVQQGLKSVVQESSKETEPKPPVVSSEGRED